MVVWSGGINPWSRILEGDQQGYSKSIPHWDYYFPLRNYTLTCVRLTIVFPEPAGPTIIRPCLTTVVSYSCIHLPMKPSTSFSDSLPHILRMEVSRVP